MELLQQQNKNLLEENKSKTTTIQMLIENQKNLSKVDLESNLTQKIETVTQKSNRKLSIHKTDEIKCSNIHMKIMINLAIHTIAVLLQIPVPCLTKFLTKSHRVIYKRKTIEKIL